MASTTPRTWLLAALTSRDRLEPLAAGVVLLAAGVGVAAGVVLLAAGVMLLAAGVVLLASGVPVVLGAMVVGGVVPALLTPVVVELAPETA